MTGALSSDLPWFHVTNVEEVPSPALLVYPDRIESNLRRMIAMIGSVDRLRPHVKTTKMPEVVRLMLSLGIRKFKCATIAECEICAHELAPDVLLAYQPVGPNAQRIIQLAQGFPQTRFSVVADCPSVVQALSQAAHSANLRLPVLLDLDCGQHRSGIAPGAEALALSETIAQSPGLEPGGLHAYDGHLSQSDPAERRRLCETAMEPVRQLRDALRQRHLPVPVLVAGGTPTFPVHAGHPDVECSPGTCVLWDAGYGSKFADMDFQEAALVLTRVVSLPTAHRLCLDLGHKSIAAENPHPRVIFPQLPDAQAVVHSEEHLVLETDQADRFAVGDTLYGIPWHICPTVALYQEAVAIRDHQATDRWPVTARQRRITF